MYSLNSGTVAVGGECDDSTPEKACEKDSYCLAGICKQGNSSGK